jgi:hypothetical protein
MSRCARRVTRSLAAAAIAGALLHAGALLDDGAAAQSLRDQCAAATTQTHRAFCRDAADAASIVQPRLGIAAAGGNPVPGTASTLGMRIGSTPRVSIGARITATAADLPPVDRVGSTASASFGIASLSLDGSVGVYQGMRLLPTVGGFASVDLLGSVGVVPVPHGDSFDGGAPVSWALGARVGVLRESFTAPGISVSAMYRSTGAFSYGDEALVDSDAFFRMTGNRVTSLRGTVGKRTAGIGLLGGVGYDIYSSDAVLRVRDAVPGIALDLREAGMAGRRASIFGNASLTLLILNLAAEAGWQQGAPPIDGATDKRSKGGLFGGIAARLAI